jgi:hypothetical protein
MLSLRQEAEVMDEEPTVDPRNRRLAPTQEECDAWAEAERARRQTWQRGPTEFEKHEWFRHRRRRLAFDLSEPYLASTPEEIEAWSERERQRRLAWLKGPSEREQHEWAQRRLRRTEADAMDVNEAAPNEVEEWARRECQRRQAWVSGPTDQEKFEWAERQAEGFARRLLQTGFEAEQELFASLIHEAEVAGKGSFRALSRASAALWSYLVRAGQSSERETSAPRRRSRVPY